MAEYTNINHAPYPYELQELVARCSYRPGWTVEMIDMDRGQGSSGLTLVITTDTVNSYRPAQPIHVNHLFPVPPAAYDMRSWRRWLFEQFHLVELHEAMEFFQIGDERSFAPNHGHGQDPYQVRELTTETDRRTSFRNELNPE